jgi:hypothetical protein
MRDMQIITLDSLGLLVAIAVQRGSALSYLDGYEKTLQAMRTKRRVQGDSGVEEEAEEDEEDGEGNEDGEHAAAA